MRFFKKLREKILLEDIKVIERLDDEFIEILDANEVRWLRKKIAKLLKRSRCQDEYDVLMIADVKLEDHFISLDGINQREREVFRKIIKERE